MTRELDAEIAEKVFGYTLDYEFADTLGAPCVTELRDQYDEWGMLPHYSTEIDDAWYVVDKMRREGWRVSVSEVSDALWNCRFCPEDTAAYVFALADTPPLAICLAALKVGE
jgi:hypothetical protein